jgi:GNAT superfamily N-acetyltransferase
MEKTENLYQIKESSVNSPDAEALLSLLNASLAEITGSSGAGSFSRADVMGNRGVFLIGYNNCVPTACGALREFSRDTSEIKRVYAKKNSVGAARKIIGALETYARKEGFHTVQLETRIVNRHAVQFYLACGYQPCPNYGKYAGRADAICFSKAL